MSKKSTDATRAERTAALMKEQARTERRRQLMIVGAVMVVLAVIVGAGLFVMSKADKTSSSTVASSPYSFPLGDPNAPTKVVIYEDFICPACGYFESVTHEKLEQAAADGKVYVEYRPFNFLSRLGPYSGEAANAFRAVWETAGEDAAMKFHDALFKDQPSEEGPFPDSDWFVEKAVAAGADEAKVRPAIENKEYMDWVDKATADASEVRSTPTVYLNGELVQAGNLDDVAKQVLDAVG
ncbi:thioredoxin domain-containing protein [Nocardioides sp.]|uniref:thioredoxin domain-containing protein n=1 Tax=Nocardioides sp. TaxID=35761 RepID=UPI003527BC08